MKGSVMDGASERLHKLMRDAQKRGLQVFAREKLAALAAGRHCEAAMWDELMRLLDKPLRIVVED